MNKGKEKGMENVIRNTGMTRKVITVAVAAALSFSLAGVATADAYAATTKPAKASITKVTSTAPGKVTVTYKKASKAKAYQVKVAYNSKMTSGAVTKATTKTSTSIYGLAQGKTAYVKVRAYTYSKGKKVYGAWSSAKTVKIAAVGKASLNSVTSVAAGKVKATAAAAKYAKKYQFRIAAKSSMSGATNKYTTSRSTTFAGLAQGKTLYVQARGYVKVNNKNVFGPWSSVKSVKVAGIDTSKAARGQASLFGKVEGDAKNPVTKEETDALLKEATSQNVIDESIDDGTTSSGVTVSHKLFTYLQATDFGTDTDLKIDLLTPSTAKAGETPLLIWINGGGFTSSDPGNNLDTRMAFAKRGFVVASVQHRVSASNAIWPTAIQDIKAAIRYMRAHASTYKFDTNKVVVGGNSSGGYYATMIGVTSNAQNIQTYGRSGWADAKFDVGANLDQSSAVNAVLDFYGVSDLTIIGSGLGGALEESHKSAATTEALLLNGAAAASKGMGVFSEDENMQKKVAYASPFSYIDAKDPAVWMVHGTADTLVSPVASKMLQNRLDEAGVQNERTVINGGNHGGLPFIQDSIIDSAVAFLNAHLNDDLDRTEAAPDLAKGTKAYADEAKPTLEQATAGGIDVPVDSSKYSLNVANNVTYKTIKNNGTYKNLRMNIIYPSEKAKGPRPVMFVAACGGFNKSDINEAYSRYTRYAERGYVVAVAEIRVVPSAVMPAPLQDAKAAVRWLRAHAGDYNINPDCFITIGTSAGGYYAAMLGPTGNTTQYNDDIKFDVGENLQYSSAVQGVVDLYGVSDLTIIGACLSNYDVHDSESNTEALVVNGTAFGINPGGSIFSDMEKAAIYSPFTYLDADDPAFLFLHGTADMSVSPVATYEYYRQCQAAGISAERYSIKGAGHGGPKMSTDYVNGLIDKFMDNIVAQYTK